MIHVNFDKTYTAMEGTTYVCESCPLLSYTADEYFHTWYEANEHLEKHNRAGHDVPAKAYEILGDSADD